MKSFHEVEAFVSLNFFHADQAYLTCDWTHDARKLLFKPTGELIIPHSSLDEKVELKKTIKLEDCIVQFLCAEKLGPMDSW